MEEEKNVTQKNKHSTSSRWRK